MFCPEFLCIPSNFKKLIFRGNDVALFFVIVRSMLQRRREGELESLRA